MCVQIPTDLKRVPFHEHYEPPPPPEPGQRRLPEEIEADIKKQEQEFQKLTLISIGLPSEVLWFEPPTVAGWDDKENMWSTEDFHDFKFNEEKQVLTFRMGKFGTIGLAAYRYSNLPYQSWEIKPGKSDGVILNLTAAVMIIEFAIKEDKITIMQIQNGPSDALQEITGKPLSLYEVKTVLLQGGVDVFPGHDACYYVEGCAPKHRATEDHLYHCMAQLCTCYQFAWSRWNLLAGRRNIVLQMREYSHKKTQSQGEYSLLHVTPLKASIAKCTEMSQTFAEEDEKVSKLLPKKCYGCSPVCTPLINSAIFCH